MLIPADRWRDPLLALAGVLYLLPIAPAWSTAAALAWLVLQLLDGPGGDRRHWPLAALLLTLVRPWVRGKCPIRCRPMTWCCWPWPSSPPRG